ncbi:MAG: hypothetical protein QM315_05940 [Bacillota bacterium]|jgi:hypothetical protein|nr:hypothetical protein [Bacillota bacterium]NLV64191.1 hypothetical protein [Clostridiaceae bacterium]
MNNVFQKAKEYIYRKARPLDFTRWQYHFENGSKEAVLNTLSYYQNEDGGFGHALEPDAFYINNKDIADYECEFLFNTQLDDGSWNITWKWTAYLEEWPIAENWWKSYEIIKNLLYLRGFNKI